MQGSVLQHKSSFISRMFLNIFSTLIPIPLQVLVCKRLAFVPLLPSLLAFLCTAECRISSFGQTKTLVCVDQCQIDPGAFDFCINLTTSHLCLQLFLEIYFLHTALSHILQLDKILLLSYIFEFNITLELNLLLSWNKLLALLIQI